MMMDIDESFGIQPWDDEDFEWQPEEDEAGDACQHWDNQREEMKINGRA